MKIKEIKEFRVEKKEKKGKKNNFKNKGEIKEIKEIKEFPGSLYIHEAYMKNKYHCYDTEHHCLNKLYVWGLRSV